MEDGPAKKSDGRQSPASHRDPSAPSCPADAVFVAAIEMARMPMVIADALQPECPIVFANDAFLDLTGYRREEVIGRNFRFLQGPETERHSVAEIGKALERREPVCVELINYRKDGSTFWNTLSVSPVLDKTGLVTHFVGWLIDTTRRRTAAEALGQSQKMEALGQLTAGIAHDFNNLLQVILGYIDIVSSSLKKPEPDRARLTRATDTIRSAAERAANLTQQLLSFARKQRPAGRPVNLNILVAGIDDMVQRALGETIAIEKRLSPDLWACRIDPTQAELALLNILINARDAMPQGGKVTIVTENRQFDEGTGARGALGGAFATIAITDSGTGIPPAILAHVMEPFFTTKDEGKGTGLGLSMVYGFAKQSGGSVEIESVPGQGTTVRLSFPAEQARRASPRMRRDTETGSRGTETILIVDDREEVADLARTILRDHGYFPLVAMNGREALQVLDSRQDVALLFSDLIMPGGMNGVTLAREARRRRPDLKVLLTTGYAEASLERTSVGGSEFEILNKPYRRADLVARVRGALESS